MIPPSMYLTAMACSGHMAGTSLHGRCAVHVGSGTGSMKRALQLTGLFVIGVDIKPQVDAGGHVEHTAYVADYDAFEGRFGMVVEGAVHALGFCRSDKGAVAFDADCKTRSQMIINMNGMCRSSGTGNADEELSGGEEARTRDRIDRKAVQWVDSILNPHSDEECVANTIQWPHGPGGWGFSQEGAHTILLSPCGGTQRTRRRTSPIGSGPARDTAAPRPAHHRRRRPAREPMADRRNTRPTQCTHKSRVTRARSRHDE